MRPGDRPTDDRDHPFRLDPELYATYQAPLFVTIHYHLRAELAETNGGILEGVLLECAARWRMGIHAYCLMPTHLHVVCSVADESGDFETFVKRFKSEASRRLRRAGFTAFEWQRSYWDRYSRTEEEVKTRIYYTLGNPVRRGLCEKWDDWPWARYCGWPVPGEGEL
jgi:REP element-mobilizing transposase RayT